jgi:DNA-binding NtrC family response regulator
MMSEAHLNKSATDRIRVLVVDDDAAAVTGMEAVLADDVEVIACTSPEQAIRTLKRQSFDVVCSDFSMPRMNGVQLLQRAAQCVPTIGCLLITGSGEYIQRANDAAYYVLLKPYDPERLIRLVLQLGKVAQMRRTVDALRNPSS